MAWRIFDQSIFNQSQLNQISGHHVGLVVDLHKLSEPLQEQVRRGDSDVEVELFEHLTFHLKNLFFGISFVSDIDKVSQIWRIDFFILAGSEKCSDSDKLEFLSGDLSFFKISVNEIDSQEKRFVDQFELEMDINQPVDEDGSHLFIDVLLLAHVT